MDGVKNVGSGTGCSYSAWCDVCNYQNGRSYYLLNYFPHRCIQTTWSIQLQYQKRGVSTLRMFQRLFHIIHCSRTNRTLYFQQDYRRRIGGLMYFKPQYTQYYFQNQKPLKHENHSENSKLFLNLYSNYLVVKQKKCNHAVI